MLLRKYKILLITLFIVTKLVGQKNQYWEGYVVNQKLDTIYGQILYQDNQANPKAIRVKKGEKLIDYKSDQILYAEIIGKAKFFSEKVKYSVNPHKIGELRFDSEVIWKEDQVFLEAINLGQVNLFKFVEEDARTHFFINNEAGELIDLFVLKYEKDGSIAVVDKYKTALKRVLRTCPSIFKLIDESNFNQKSLQSIIRKYNECSNLKSIYISEAPRNGLEIYLKGGTSFTRRISTEAWSNNVGGEINFDIVLPKNNKVWGVTNGIGVRTYELAESPNFSSSLFRFNYIRYNLGIKRVFLTRENSWMNLNVGVVNSILIKLPYEWYKNYQQGLFLSVEHYYKDFGIEVRFETRNLWRSKEFAFVKENTILLWLSYRLFRGENGR